MTRTTELLKDLKATKDITVFEQRDEKRTAIYSELKGRLDVLKETLNLDENGEKDDDYLIINKNKIQEEIKLIENGI